MTGFAYTPEAVENRMQKATALAEFLAARGVRAWQVDAMSWPDRRFTERAAGVRSSSPTTWTLVAQIMRDRETSVCIDCGTDCAGTCDWALQSRADELVADQRRDDW